MRRNIVLICALLIATPAAAQDMVLANGTIIDGTLKARYAGNIRIRNGKISDIGLFKVAAGETVLDVKGLIVAPGFIDLNNRSAGELAKDQGLVSQISQGITTAVLGADGTGPYAVEDFMLPFDEKSPGLNIAMLVGHGTVRRQIMGSDYKRAATADEIQRMSELVENAMREGAFGLSSDLQAEPASYATSEELRALAKAISRFGGVFVMDALKQGIDVGRAAKIVVQITHIKTAQGLADLDKARTQNIDVAADTAATMGDKDLRVLLQHPWVMIASDSAGGPFLRVLNQYVRQDKLLTLERAVRKMSGLPASRVGLRERGVLAKGAAADIVVFDPLAATVSMKYVFVNGTVVVKNGEPTGEHSGHALR